MNLALELAKISLAIGIAIIISGLIYHKENDDSD